MKRKIAILLAAVLVVPAALVVWRVSVYRVPEAEDVAPASQPTSMPGRPAAWATSLSAPGLPNFHKVTDDLYRGAQPTAEGMRELAKMGIKTVINLRAGHSDRDEIEGTGLDYIHISAKPWHAEDEDVIKFLQAVADPDRGPFFVHCKRGADRTGLMCAVYRVAFCGWTNEQAAAEMTEGGFDFAKEWVNIIKYMKNVDIEKLTKEAEIARPRRDDKGQAPENTILTRSTGSTKIKGTRFRRWEWQIAGQRDESARGGKTRGGDALVRPTPRTQAGALRIGDAGGVRHRA